MAFHRETLLWSHNHNQLPDRTAKLIDSHWKRGQLVVFLANPLGQSAHGKFRRYAWGIRDGSGLRIAE